MARRVVTFEIPTDEEPKVADETIRKSVLIKQDGSVLIVGAATQKRIEECCRELVEVMMSRDRTTAFAAMQYVLSALWCNGLEDDTLVVAVDSWRKYARGVEVGILDLFDEIRHGEKS